MIQSSLIVFFMASAMAGVRTVDSSDKAIAPIYLKLGRSTVLKFRDTPVNVILGNKNYFNVEYINNDVTIQPLGQVETNLFVYTKSKRTYSFALKVNQGGRVDDIAHVKWKSHFKRPTRPSRPRPFKERILKFEDFEFVVKGLIKQYEHLILDCYLINTSKSPVRLQDIKIKLTRSKRPLSHQEVVVIEKSILPNARAKLRILTTAEKRKGFTLNLSYQGRKKKTIIWRRDL